MNEYQSLFEEFPDENPEVLGDILPFLPNCTKEIPELADNSWLTPDPQTFSKESLSKNPGMEWMMGVDFILISPHSTDLNEQRAHINSYIDSLKENAFTLDRKSSEFFDSSYSEKVIAVDTETDGLDTRVLYDLDGNLIKKVNLAGICLSVNENVGYYLPVENTQEDGISNWDSIVITEALDRIHQEFCVIYHNAQYDREVLAIHGVTGLRPFPYFFDTQLLTFIYDCNSSETNLKRTSELYLNRKMVELADLFVQTGQMKKSSFINFNRLPAVNAVVYGASDAINTFFLFTKYLTIEGSFNMFNYERIPVDVDHKMVDTLRNLYRAGLPINFKYSLQALKDVCYRLVRIEQEIYNESQDWDWNIGSSQQLSIKLFEVYKIPPLPNAKRGKPSAKHPDGLFSTAEDALFQLFEKNPDYKILRLIVTYRKLKTAATKVFSKYINNSYIDALIPYTRSQIQYNQTVIPTGRLASSSSKGGECITCKKNPSGTISKKYDKGAWSCGFNSQGIPAARLKKSKAKRITFIGKGAALEEQPYSPRVLADVAEVVSKPGGGKK